MTGWLNNMATLMEELNSGLGLVLALIALASAWAGVVATWVKLGGRVDSIETDIQEDKEALAKTMETHHQTFRDVRDKHDKWHGQHFDAIRDIENDAAKLGQSVQDHHATDEYKFKSVEDQLKELKLSVASGRAEILAAIADLRRNGNSK